MLGIFKKEFLILLETYRRQQSCTHISKTIMDFIFMFNQEYLFLPHTVLKVSHLLIIKAMLGREYSQRIL